MVPVSGRTPPFLVSFVLHAYTHPIPPPASWPQTGPWCSRAACAWWDWGRSPFGHCAKAWSHCDSELQNVPWCISALLPGWAWGAGRKRAGRGAQGRDTEKQWSAGAGDGRKGKQISGGGRKKPHQRIYKVAFTSLGGGVTWSFRARFVFFSFRVGKKKSIGHFQWDIFPATKKYPLLFWNLIGWCARAAGALATRLLGHDLIFIPAQHGLMCSIADRTAANLLCNPG